MGPVDLPFSEIRFGEEGCRLLGVKLKEGESFENALKRFKKKCEKAGILADVRKHQYFEKPSERKKRKANAARRKMLSAQRVRD